jgi:peroxiredoxin
VLLVAACSGDAADDASPAAARTGSAQSAEAVPAAASPRGQERPLPAFSGFTLDGRRVEVSSFLGKRLLIFFFNPEVRQAGDIADGVAAVSKLRSEHNFAILGVGVGSERRTLERFVAEHGLDFPVIDDSGATITRRLRLAATIALVGVDAEGFLTFGMNQFPDEAGAARQVETILRSALRLPAAHAETQPVLGSKPLAPDFEAVPLDGDEPLRLSALRGRPVVLIFFLHTCPHCHHALAFLKETLASLPEDSRPQVVGVEITGRAFAVRQELKRRGLDFFPVVFDGDGSIRAAYGVFAGVPDLVLIDAKGRIAARINGWEESRDPPLLRMRLARLAGAPVPMLLKGRGFSGSEICGVCHESEYETWNLTTHAAAFDTLVRHGAERDEECVGCHVVGYGKPGGYSDSRETPELENVGCESCHGRGGPHLSPQAVSDGNYAPLCTTCHDPEHSLGFEYDSFLPRISHAANAHLLKLSVEEKQALLEERGRPRQGLLPSKAAYVGSDACQSCHPAEYATWSRSGHARAVDTLKARQQAGNAECLACHTTAYGKTGGFPAGAAPADHADLARVGCESCHGPGGDHIGEEAVKRGSIVSLGDKCDSCVILQICGGCHDDANDPGFEFEVQDKIEAQRHGTIEPGTGKPGKKSAAAPASDAARVAHAFELLGGPGGGR